VTGTASAAVQDSSPSLSAPPRRKHQSERRHGDQPRTRGQHVSARSPKLWESGRREHCPRVRGWSPWRRSDWCFDGGGADSDGDESWDGGACSAGHGRLAGWSGAELHEAGGFCLPPGQSLAIPVAAKLDGLALGTYRSTLSVAGSLVDVRVIGRRRRSSRRPRHACQVCCRCSRNWRKFLAPIQWPVSLEARVVDDCGISDPSGSVTASFSNGDPAVSLQARQRGKSAFRASHGARQRDGIASFDWSWKVAPDSNGAGGERVGSRSSRPPLAR